ncbi:helix-turn-helix transcriptional regulator [Sphingomonas oligophenolica]|uniref:Helix-turn-helix transcriptional regulator n=1 Tax=Sphingomonas oligophenolica TaxID=301154 RepID=A0ABU9Y273_9SPHN
MPADLPPGDLLEALFEGIFEQPTWSRFLDRLRAVTRADYASLIFRPPAPARPSVVHLYSGEGSPPLIQQLYRDRLHKSDPLPYHQFEEGRVHALEALLDTGDPADQAFFHALLAPSGMNFVRQMRVVEQSGVNVWLTLSRRGATFEPEQHALVEALAPWLRTALRTYVALERERFAASLANEATRRLDLGWLTLDAAGRVLETNAQGAQILENSNILRRDGRGMLSARSPEMRQEIAGEIAALLADPGRRSRAMILSREPWLDMLLMPANRHMISSGPPPALIAYVHADSGSSADRCAQLAHLFGLLPSEARLALALSRGMTIAEAAAELGLTIQTARTYSKIIYGKTGARGQTDLVRFIHRSMLAFA